MTIKMMIAGLAFASNLGLSACSTVQSAPQADCTAVGLRVGTSDFDACFKACVCETEMDYSNTFLPSSN